MRNENVIPNGTPDSTKPRNKGIAEQEQKGVTMPNRAAITLPVNVFFAFESLAGSFSSKKTTEDTYKENNEHQKHQYLGKFENKKS